ncbi:hypothetical protein DFJ58DRAFT_809959 [Suillus subalutaceus]|uniref:uncharacterized protein n=1 Tax=Suillus subalutaceus TaxID=48586 RepID=UPI001B884927|nr:uncharacterized protein DFJ58DRAFT_809959 [Suillus subalutaceus]KAG1840712.1 hypothetical protein DFJ58DRAFT_809959 [Suillus subalutaceus]
MVFSALTFGQEVELIWRRRWSLMTFLYLCVRYAGIGYAVYVWMFKPLMLRSLPISHNRMIMLANVSTISMTDAVSIIINDAIDWTSDVVDVMLGASELCTSVILT